MNIYVEVYAAVAIALLSLSSFLAGYWKTDAEAFGAMFFCSIAWAFVIALLVLMLPFWGLNELGKRLATMTTNTPTERPEITDDDRAWAIASAKTLFGEDGKEDGNDLAGVAERAMRRAEQAEAELAQARAERDRAVNELAVCGDALICEQRLHDATLLEARVEVGRLERVIEKMKADHG